MLALGARLFSRTKDFVGGEGLTATCAWAYESSVAGVGPESSTFYNPTDASRYRIVKAPEGTSPAFELKLTGSSEHNRDG